MTEPSGIITSQDMYSDDNGQAAACAWFIEAPLFHVIQLQVIHIDIQPSPNCRDNFIAVYDGNKIVALLCGHYVPPAFQSKRQHIIIMFRKTSPEYQYEFNLTYAHVKAPTCGSHQIDRIGNLTPLDSDGDTLYDNNLDCTWKIVSLKASQIEQVYITEMDIQSSDKCESDYLEILDENETFGVYCGTQQPPLTETTTSALYLNFHSDSSVNGKGFIAIYAVIDIDRQCGGLLTQPTGSIESVDRDGDGKYDALLNCAWAIIAPVDSPIELQFLSIDLEYGEDCEYDFVQVFDGLDVFRGRHCGLLDVTPYVIRSTSNVLYVEFFSDYETVEEGFRATYRHIGSFTEKQSTLYAQTSSKATSGTTSVSPKSSTSNSEIPMTHAKSSKTTTESESRDGHSTTTTDLESSSPFWTSGNHSQVTSEYTTGIKQTASLSKMSTSATTILTDSSSLAATGTSARCSAYLYMLPVAIFAY